MVDGLHILIQNIIYYVLYIIQNRRKKPLAIALSGQGGSQWEYVEGDLTNVQYQPIRTVTMNLLSTINTS
jgi:hypothetical protein